jgi:TonB family protein
MKTKNNSASTAVQRLLFSLVITLLVCSLASSCAARKKSATTKTAVSQPSAQVPPQKPVAVQNGKEPFVVVEEMPLFPGGDSALLMYVAKNTRYPLEAKEKNITGKVILRFVIKEDGKVSDVTVARGVDPLLDNESIRVVSSLPDFKPGKQGGVAVPVYYMLPITFTLDGKGQQRPPRFDIVGIDTIYTYTDNPPQYPGGNEALKNFKAEKIKFPTDLVPLGIEGVAFVKFFVGKNGSLSDFEIIQGVSPSIDEEALRVARLLPSFIPGKDNGKPVKFLYTTNFDFLLTPRVPQVFDKDAPFVVVEEMPVFPGGDAALLTYIGQNTKYPEKAKANKVEGKVIIRFCVTDTGGVDRITVLKGVDPELDNEAVRVVKTLPKFKPGKQGGKSVNVWYMVPITFSAAKSAEQTVALPPIPPPPPSQPMGYDEAPKFKGGENAIYKFINSRLVIPKVAKENNISAKVNVRFSVNTDGSVGDVTASNDNPELCAEAIRVIKLLPSWTPGKLAGTPVKVSYSLPVLFNLK